MKSPTSSTIDLSQQATVRPKLRANDDLNRPIEFNEVMLNPDAFHGRECTIEIGSNQITDVLTTDPSGFSIGNARLKYKDLYEGNGGKIPRPFTAVLQQQNRYDFLIPKHLLAASQAVLVGQTMKKKTFIAIDLGLRIASGMEWNGLPTKRGKVVYIAGEGSEDVRNRMEAWSKYHNVLPDNFYLIDEPIDFFKYDLQEDGAKGDFGGLLKNLITMSDVALVVVDTFRTCFSGVENLSDDVAQYFKNARIINRRIGATVLTLHHPAKNGSTNAKGAGNFLTDVENYWSIDAKQTLQFQKVKGSPNPPSIKLQTKEFAGSLIVDYTANPGSNSGKQDTSQRTSTNNNEQLALDCLQRVLAASNVTSIPITDWQKEYYRNRDGDKSSKATAFCRLKPKLVDAGVIIIDENLVSLNTSPDITLPPFPL